MSVPVETTSLEEYATAQFEQYAEFLPFVLIAWAVAIVVAAVIEVRVQRTGKPLKTVGLNVPLLVTLVLYVAPFFCAILVSLKVLAAGHFFLTFLSFIVSFVIFGAIAGAVKNGLTRLLGGKPEQPEVDGLDEADEPMLNGKPLRRD